MVPNVTYVRYVSHGLTNDFKGHLYIGQPLKVPWCWACETQVLPADRSRTRGSETA